MMGTKNHRPHKKFRWLVAYICMPLIFALIGLAVFTAALGPVKSQLEMSLNSLFNSGELYLSKADIIPVLKEEPTVIIPETAETEEIIEEEKEVVSEPNIGEQYGRMICERLGMDLPIYFGDNDAVLNMGVGTYPGSWIPGCGHTTLLAGHNNTDFTALQNIEYGDEFTIITDYGQFEYRVSEFSVVNETEVEACRLEEEIDQVVMYTCYPFYRISGRRTERFFVYLEKVSGPEIELTDYFFKD